MISRRAKGLALAAGVLAALLAAGCGSEPSFQERRFEDVRQALLTVGLRICEQATPARLVQNATDRRSYVVAFACDHDDAEAVVDVIAWPDQGARDEAIRRFEGQSRPISQHHGVQLAYGQFTIDVSGDRDEDVTGRVIDAMTRLGAG